MDEARVFLGWERPFLAEAVRWLLERRDALPGMLVVVPTAQSGRRLREALAEAAGSVLAPKVVTPGWFLQRDEEGVAADWVERAAWIEVLEEVDDWGKYSALFPQAPEEDDAGWASGLALEMVRLRRSLQENGLTLVSAAQRLGKSIEADRWEVLARLEVKVEEQLKEWGFRSRSGLLATAVRQPQPPMQLVLVGVADFPPVAERAWARWPAALSALVAAPESEAQNFSAFGRPLDAWGTRSLGWPDANGSVSVLADPRQQAAEALRRVAAAGSTSDCLALGSADSEVGDELARAFSRAGWPAFHPAAAVVTSGLARWLRVWSNWLAEPTLAALADLLTLPQVRWLGVARRAQTARELAKLRDRWMLKTVADLRRRLDPEKESEDLAVKAVLDAASAMESWRAGMLGQDFPATLARMIDILARGAEDEAAHITEWLVAATPVIQCTRRGARFWLDLMLDSLPSAPPEPPAGRVIDVQGWLELLHEPASHLVLCGVNEGKVPARGGGEPWLGEASRRLLGLVTDAQRAARDAYLYHALLESRRSGGRVDILCGKTGAGGEGLLPSRLLLAVSGPQLPGRVKQLFAEIEVAEAGVRWQADQQWRAPVVAPRAAVSVTALRDYLACPFRYYLKQVVGMRAGAPDRHEWDARDFGNVAHEVLERWGRDVQARAYQESAAIHAWVSAELDRVVAERFGQRVPLSVSIQTEALRQRLVWFSRVQASQAADGWEIIAVERGVTLTLGDTVVKAKIDRIDRHASTGEVRVIDYKTGKVEAVEGAHRKRLTPSSQVPAHLQGADCPAVFAGLHRGKPADFLWLNLQLPLYVLGVEEEFGAIAIPAYFSLADTEDKVAVHEWRDFGAQDLACAKDCATWLTNQIAAGVFWPPAETVEYDDIAVLVPRGHAAEAFAPPLKWRAEADRVVVRLEESIEPEGVEL
jgi:ATP-dependent helicase/nuclease subunit B